MFLTNIQKDSLNLHYKKQCETEVKNFFDWFFNINNMLYANVDSNRDPLKQNTRKP